MKHTISKLVPRFNTARMVREYTRRFYVTGIKLSHNLTDNDLAAARSLTAWKDRVRRAWPGVIVREVRLDSPEEVAVGEPLQVAASSSLARSLPPTWPWSFIMGQPGEVTRSQGRDRAHAAHANRSPTGAGASSAEIGTGESGAHAFAARVVPYNPAMTHPYETSPDPLGVNALPARREMLG